MLSFNHNIDSVIDSIDDVQEDLGRELRKRVGAAMRVVKDDALGYIARDPNYTGDLATSLTYEESGLTFSVYTDKDYAPIVEYGSGERTNESYQHGNDVPSEWPSAGSAVPQDFPYDSPDIPLNRSNPKFQAFVGHIVDWMRKKGVLPETGDMYFSATLIAETIIKRGNYAHPFLRPAWFDNEYELQRAARNALKNAVR